MTEFERKYPHEVDSKVRCPKCTKRGKSIRMRIEDGNTETFCCGKCGETWKVFADSETA